MLLKNNSPVEENVKIQPYIPESLKKKAQGLEKYLYKKETEIYKEGLIAILSVCKEDGSNFHKIIASIKDCA